MIQANRIVKLVFDNVHWLALAGIMGLAVWLRAIGWNPNDILDYDPWWFFRHAQEILSNNFMPLKWDVLSYFPPGRPVDYYLGWSYMIAAFYKVVSGFMSITLTKFAGIFVAFFAASTAIPAYFVGKHVTNRWGGLATAFFATITVTFISVSIAGYIDSDATDAFYTFICVATTLFAIKKADIMDYSNRQAFMRTGSKYLLYLAPAIASYWFFAFNWNSSWYIFFIFAMFIPILIALRVFEGLIRREHKMGVRLIVSKIRDNRSIIFAILAIGVIGEIVTLATQGWPFNTIPPSEQLIQGNNLIGTSGLGTVLLIAFLGLFGAMSGVAFGRKLGLAVGAVAGLAFGIFIAVNGLTGVSLIVDQSIAELQPITDIVGQFGTIVGRVGAVPIVFAFAMVPIIALKIVFKRDIHTAEYFSIMWFIITLFLLTKGIRFSLLFSLATATAAGFTIGNAVSFAMKRGSMVLLGAVFAVVVIGGLLQFNDNYSFANGASVSGGLGVDDNWHQALDWLKTNADPSSLVTTWWDPGHIITGITGLKVMADGAHCGPDSCFPMDHNVRIQDMGRVFAISDENEAVGILDKYRGLTPQQCQQLQQRFPGLFVPQACDRVTDMYVIASSDLIGKYYWLAYFGTGQGATYTSCGANQQETQRLGAPTYICSSGAPTEISLIQQNNNVFAVMNSPAQGIRNVPVHDLVMYQNGNRYVGSLGSNVTNAIDGMAWVDPSFGTLVFMQPNVEHSIFTNMFFFDGKGVAQLGIPPLQRFNETYANSEVKLFKVDFAGQTPSWVSASDLPQTGETIGSTQAPGQQGGLSQNLPA